MGTASLLEVEVFLTPERLSDPVSQVLNQDANGYLYSLGLGSVMRNNSSLFLGFGVP